MGRADQPAPLAVGPDFEDLLDTGNVSYTGKHDRVLILTPLKDAESHISQHVELLSELTYPHLAIDLAFLVGDSTDDTLTKLKKELEVLQDPTNDRRIRSAPVLQKDFGKITDQGVEQRHAFRAQASRRKAIGRARNYLLYSALTSEHDWVYWRDVDIVENPSGILEDFMKHDKDILVPSEWPPGSSNLSSWLISRIDVWFHRLDKNGKDIEGRCRWIRSSSFKP